MIRAVVRRGLPLVGAALLLLSAVHAQDKHRGRKYKPPPPTCRITVTVVKADDGKPVEDAAVVFHPFRDKKDEGNMELKTNQDGKASLDVVPIGDLLRLQVIANGYQTFGNDYQLPDDTKTITVKLHRPVKQYSIYQNHPQQSSGQPPQSTPPPQ